MPADTIPAETRPNSASRIMITATDPTMTAATTTEQKAMRYANRNRLNSSSGRLTAERLSGPLLFAVVSVFAVVAGTACRGWALPARGEKKINIPARQAKRGFMRKIYADE